MMSPQIPMLETVVDGLREHADEFVFVGGAVLDLLLTEPRRAETRVTYDVDAIVELASRQDFDLMEERLRKLGFANDLETICRWKVKGVTVDVVPTSPGILGFSNPWYASAFRTPLIVTLPSGRTIRVIDPPHFVATKLAAYDSRGHGDLFASHDLEDLVTLLDGRPELVFEMDGAPVELRHEVGRQIQDLLSLPVFFEAVEGHLGVVGDAYPRATVVLERLQRMVQDFD